MAIALGVLTALVCLLVVVYPLFRGARAEPRLRRLAEIERLRRLQADLYEQITQLRTDNAAGSVSDDDYREQLRELRVAAAETLRALDHLGHQDREVTHTAGSATAASESSMREQLEREIAALRAARGGRTTGRDTG